MPENDHCPYCGLRRVETSWHAQNAPTICNPVRVAAVDVARAARAVEQYPDDSQPYCAMCHANDGEHRADCSIPNLETTLRDTGGLPADLEE